VRYHLIGNRLLNKSLALITADELRAWRNNLISKGLTASSVNRVRNNLRACLELAMSARSHVWKEGLETLPNAQRARAAMIYPDATISALVTEAYRHDPALGLLFDVLSITGTRPVQAQRLHVEDLIVSDPERPRLMMNKSAKGGGRNRAEKKTLRFPVPITKALAAKLQAAAKGRADNARLLLQSDGQPWNENNPSGDYRKAFAEVAKAMGLPANATAYLFRHSSIVRMLLGGVHTKIVADLHDTSEPMIRAHYAKFLVEHSDDVARAVLLHHDEPAPPADNVVALPVR
jgi:integrase